jgi:hypothetical protein
MMAAEDIREVPDKKKNKQESCIDFPYFQQCSGFCSKTYSSVLYLRML